MAVFSLSDCRRFIESYPEESYWLGMDVHKRSYHIALCDSAGNTYTWSAPAIPERLVQMIEQHRIPIASACYESGPTGFSLARTLMENGIPCILGAPNKIPRSVSPGSKTDRLDCIKLARLALLRRRHQITDSIRQCKQRIKALFLFHGIEECPDLKHWRVDSRKRLLQIQFSQEIKHILESHLN